MTDDTNKHGPEATDEVFDAAPDAAAEAAPVAEPDPLELAKAESAEAVLEILSH